MSTTSAPAAALESAASAAGLTIASIEPGTDFAGAPTTRATLVLGDSQQQKTLTLELSETFDASDPSFGTFTWPFHASTSGADTYVVHGDIHLADGRNTELHAKIAAALTQTFAET